MRVLIGGKYFYVHRLVGEAFIDNSEDKPCIDHINGDKTLNTVENLRWVTIQENNNNPITKQKMSIGSIGRKHSEETKRKISMSMMGNKNKH